MKITILDGYIDEPSRLGVPPFISPYPRYVAGAVECAGHESEYLTIDHWRKGATPSGNLLFVISGAMVPGKYLRSMPMSIRERGQLLQDFPGEAFVWSPLPVVEKPKSVRAAFVHSCDPDAFLFDLLTTGKGQTRRRQPDEWSAWAVKGANIIRKHHDFPQPLIAEIDMSYGCPRFFSGGCSFCIEPLYGEPEFRMPKSVIDEMKSLLKAGCTNFRLGGQSCIFSYMADGIGEKDPPKPNVEALAELLGAISKLDGIKVLHTDNANPATIAKYPEESKAILDKLVKVCTGGNALSLGLESADPFVRGKNNLNASAEDTLAAIRLINKVGAERGKTGLPKLLPGLNFVAGLEGETEETFELNKEFLLQVLNEGLILRRINIRQVAPTRREFKKFRHHREFIRFKEFVRGHIDRVMLERVAPQGTLLRDVFTEVKIGKLMFARQIGTYPILVGIPQDLEMGQFVNVKVTAHGSRSLTAVQYPLNVNKCQMSALEALPGIGRKRAARLVRARPLTNQKEIEAALGDLEAANIIMDYLSFS
jgi:radical SAM superfamily enzyme with C-terminal helix-hairpin-helix motif